MFSLCQAGKAQVVVLRRAGIVLAADLMTVPTRPWQYLFYPELRGFDPSRQAAALKAAAETAFDGIES